MGDRENIRFARGNLLFSSMQRGRWDELIENADRFIAECESSPHNMEGPARVLRANIRLARGDIDGAHDDWDRGHSLAREMHDPQRMMPALLGSARGLAWLGRIDEAQALVFEAMELARANPTIAHYLGQAGDVLRKLDVAAAALEIIALAPDSPWKDAALAEASGEYARAAEIYRSMPAPTLEAEVRFGAGEALLEDGRVDEGLAELEKALAFYRPVRATFFVERGEALLAGAQSESA
jgi:tetratricopeptide (TPR) repeat protein